MINPWNNNKGAKKAHGNSIMIKDSIKSFSILFPKCRVSVAAELLCVCGCVGGCVSVCVCVFSGQFVLRVCVFVLWVDQRLNCDLASSFVVGRCITCGSFSYSNSTTGWKHKWCVSSCYWFLSTFISWKTSLCVYVSVSFSCCPSFGCLVFSLKLPISKERQIAALRCSF